MKTVHEVSRITGVSIRTLHYYDKIGLLPPTGKTEAGYRLYDDADLERLQHILLFRELQFPLKEIRTILESPEFDRNRALDQQIALLRMKKEHLENLIDFAHEIRQMGVNKLDFSAFDTKKLEEYAAQAKASWGSTEAYQEFEKKHGNRSEKENQKIASDLMKLLAEFGKLSGRVPEDAQVQCLVKDLQNYITRHYYTCTKEILASLGSMYSAGGSMTENIDRAGGKGTAQFAADAIAVYCGR